jgi:cytochrome o ubiquinol oxidase subunit III
MALVETLSKEQLEHLEAHTFDKNYFGFWVYLMTDLLIFGVLFATYAVLHQNSFGGPTTKDLYDLPFALWETLILLTSSFTSGVGMLAAHNKQKTQTLIWFGLTFLLGVSFLGLELYEFTKLFYEGYGFGRSAFLSSFFALVGTHGLHITSGLLWMAVVMIFVWRQGLTTPLIRKLTLLSLFWHFLDIVWIFIFTVVYLMGVM